jgi:subtilase-type serine protease
MTVRGGAQVNSGNAGFGGFAGSHGDVVVEGIDTRWGNSGNMVIGGNATGQLTVRDGGRVETATAVLGGPATTGFFSGPAGNGTVFVSGAGSAFVASGNVSVGGDAATAGGRGRLEVADGGLVQVGGTLKVWDEGTLQIRGGMLLASQLDNRGTLMGVGTVQADVSNSGRLAPGLSPGYLLLSGNFEQTSTGVLEIELHDMSTYDQLAIEGGALLGGTLSLICSGGCRYDAGDSLQLVFAAGGLSGKFADITFSGLNPNSFELVYGADEVRLQVLSNVSPVPEPSTYAMLLAGLGVLGTVARRRSRQQQATPVTACL